MAGSYNICLDVGGTKVLGAIFNEKDEIIYRLKKRSKSGGSAAGDVEKVIVDVVEEMIRESGISALFSARSRRSCKRRIRNEQAEGTVSEA